MKKKKNKQTNEPKQWNSIFLALQFYRHLFADTGLKIRLQISIIYELLPFQDNENGSINLTVGMKPYRWKVF